MNVLVLESDPGAAQATEARLTEAGHAVLRCHEPDAPSFPCVGVTAHCPIEGADVAVVVRGEAHPGEITAREDGVTCALKHFVPVVVTGHHELSPIVPFASAVSAGPETVVTAAEHAAGEQPRAHRRAAEVVFREVLDHHGFQDVPAEVVVRRAENRVRVELVAPADLPRQVIEVASVRIGGAIRAIDEHAAGISVCVAPDPRLG